MYLSILVALAALCGFGYFLYIRIKASKARRPTRFDDSQRDVPTRDDRNPLP